ncbi:MAG: hypothetical protein A2V76_04085 [Candidatus Aminicenantes bacterium RBG_16_63_14]|nr:MAG: hypothetical protein A2V76_04085 [Candidatus Aminicenantes bacterium RBG_16_63_14]OGD28109.1 MAG: hypothetical protein A2V57_00995 [Candidatus Aminicenantes bacterium RBG_19FT_COMBO_65_30]
MNKHVRASLALLLLAGVLTLSSCAAFDQMASALANLQRLKFKLSGVRDFRLLGLDISGKTMLSEFNALDALRLVEAYRSMKLPVDFIVDVLAVNPNDGTGETRQTTSTLTGLECRLLIDGRPTIVGNIDSPIEIPGTGRESVIPLRLSFDLFEFFAGEQYEDLIQLALAIGGKNRTATRIALDAQPTVSTPAGPITYPGRVTIVSTEFR